ncbi:MAG: 3-phosphoshikimate 1-carboxyvinyltransferase [Chlamydiae bacterium CG10_big_fil_rev_8_21_14_0_10_42_34]|nr:MAG: 3-phosphoshikimate 1-carboxyvinyltransferase [Chlamydiae bacterium CG10_big_fil_rev_8_21_14_0_10_42_34]
MQIKIRPSKLSGSIAIPSSKSHTIRALIFSMMAKGKSKISNPLISPDTFAMLDAMRSFGAKIKMENKSFIVEGTNGKLKPADNIIECGNSGQVLRFIGALAALLPSYTVLTGDFSIRHNRPVGPLLSALTQLGAFATSTRLDGYAPIVIKGPLNKESATLDGSDSQPVSGLLMLGAFIPLELFVTNPGEKPWVNLTLSWFDKLGIAYENRNFEHYKMKGGAQLDGFDSSVAADFSSAAFPIAAALLTNSEIGLKNIDLTDVQGDKAIIGILKSMGATFESHGSYFKILQSEKLKGARIDVNDFIDALPILAVIACFANSKTEIVNGAIARKKESDRIHCIALELKKMGANIEETPDGLIIYPSKLSGSIHLDSHKDHRIAMALTVAALASEGESFIDGVECVEKSYPTFFDDLKQLGAQIETSFAKSLCGVS